MALAYSTILLPSSLLSSAKVAVVREAVDKFSGHMVHATWQNLSTTFAALYAELQTLVTSVSGLEFPVQRLPKVAQLLAQQGFGTARAAVMRGDLGSFLVMGVPQAIRGADVMHDIRSLLNTYRDSGQTSS